MGSVSIVRRRPTKWIVSVDGIDQLSCCQKSMALKIVRDARAQLTSNARHSHNHYEIRGIHDEPDSFGASEPRHWDSFTQ